MTPRQSIYELVKKNAEVNLPELQSKKKKIVKKAIFDSLFWFSTV